MINFTYLTNQLPNLVSQSRYHLVSYNLIRCRRFITQTILLFIFQYLTTVYLRFSYPALPIYLPIGTTFTMFYLFGINSFFGLFLGGFCAYFLNGLPLSSSFLYLTADIGGGYLGAYLCRNIFPSDITQLREWIRFFIKNAFITCLLSSLFRISTLFLNFKIFHLKNDFFYFIDLWLADVNAILVFSGFLLSWYCVPFSRVKISDKKIKKFYTALFILFIIFSILFMKKPEDVYLIALIMLTALTLSHYYGHLISTLLLYAISIVYLAYFVTFQHPYLQWFGLGFYTLVPFIFLLFTVSMFYLGLKKGRSKRPFLILKF